MATVLGYTPANLNAFHFLRRSGAIHHNKARKRKTLKPYVIEFEAKLTENQKNQRKRLQGQCFAHLFLSLTIEDFE